LNTNEKATSENITTLEIQENLEPMPTLEEVEAALKKLRNNKAPGMDSIQAELLKNMGPQLLKCLHELTVQIWTSEIIPEE
jgi:hypothetical protein